jgi:hypothetical protein
MGRGQIQPLDAILRTIATSVSGTVLSARFGRNASGAPIYTLVVLSDGGRYRKVVVDAERNVILQVR